MTKCFHCGDPMPPGEPITVCIDGEDRPVCCHGCAAVAQMIVGNGLEDFYRFRTGPSSRPDDDTADEWTVYDQPEMQADFVREIAGGTKEAALLVEGLYCGACSWLIEHTLQRDEGLVDVRVNPTTGRALLRWDPEKTSLSRLLRTMAAIGYRAHPLSGARLETLADGERKRALKRLVVAGLGMMQVMSYAVALYLGAFDAMDPVLAKFLRLVSLLVATPVVAYSARPFFQSAWRDLRARRPGMDVPVSLAIGGAYLASVYHTLIGAGEVYFDSVTMFTFFLLIGRYAEMAARHRASDATDSLTLLIPPAALRIVDGREEAVPVKRLQPGDPVRVRPGDTVPADGVVTEGRSRFDESMLTGESSAVERGPGEPVIAGSMNQGNPIAMEVHQVGQGTVLAGIGRLLDRAQSQRPRITRFADTAAGYFVLVLLMAAAGVALWWGLHEPARAFPVTLAVLVVTCPCALSLATPAALVAATGRLTRAGLVITRADAVETLARATHVIMDKTGTLTHGRLTVQQIQPLRGGDPTRLRAIAAGLEAGSEHPIAGAFRNAPAMRATGIRTVPGRGIEGAVEGHLYRIGRPQFVAELSGTPLPDFAADGNAVWVALGSGQGIEAVFRLMDTPRPEARETLHKLQALGLKTIIASGDRTETVAALADELGIDEFHGDMRPEDKLETVHKLQAQGAVVAMVGDGINDAPVLAGADVSVAMGAGTALARTAADAVLLADDMEMLAEGVRVARKTMAVIRENLGWAILYNAVAVPLAATGLVQPWMAAIGMSASSLLVVLNAVRLTRRRTPPACPTPQVGLSTTREATS